MKAWLDSIARSHPFFEVADLPGRAVADSRLWTERFFREGADPWSAARVRRTVHVATPLTLDLLRHEYAVGAWALTVTESRAFVHVRVESGPDARELFEVRSFDAPVDPLAMSTWTDRAEAGDRWLLFYKKLPPVAGFLNQQQWFDGEFRRRYG